MPIKYAGADWLEQQITYWLDGKKVTLSPLGREVADILGQVYRGLYHIKGISSVKSKRTQWDNRNCISVMIHTELATHDGSELSCLFVLCFDRKIRLAISAIAPGYLELTFHDMREDNPLICGKLPSLEDKVLSIRQSISLGDIE